VAIRPPKYNSQGYTLLEMLAVLSMVGIIMGFALPSLLSLNKPLRDGSLQFKSHLSLIRSKAISSNQAYRLRPKFPNRTDYPDGIPRNFIVEYAANCRVITMGAANNGWEMASQFDLDLPANIGITDITSTTLPVIGAVSNDLNWNSGAGICFDNRGIVDTSTRVIVKDFRGDNIAKIALLDVNKIGNVDLTTYGDNTPSSPDLIPADTQGNPVF
jgi:prepilin-type N-terminal cleavage/methylation domain-containing protein